MKGGKKHFLIIIPGKNFLRCIVFEFLCFLEIFTFFEKFSQVAILKLEHCGLFYLVAYGCLHKSLYFESDHLNYFFFENYFFSKIFENLDFGFRKVYRRSTKFSKWENKNTRFCFGINKLSNAKNRNVLPSKLRPVKTFKVGKKKKKLFRRASERWQTIGAASPQTEEWSAFFEQHSTITIKSQCATEQLGPLGLIMDTKYEKRLWLVETSFDVLWSAVTAESASLLLAHLCTPARRTSRCRMVTKKIKFENLVDFQLVGPLKQLISVLFLQFFFGFSYH